LPPSRAAIPFGAQLQAVQWQPQTQPTAGAQAAGAFTLSVIVPVLNEERGLAQLIARLEPALARANAPVIAPITRAATSSDAPAIGAAILPFLDRVLPTESALMQAGR